MQLLFLLFIFNINTYSQSLEIGDVEDILMTHFDTENKQLFVLYKNDSISIIDLSDYTKKTIFNVKYPPMEFGFLPVVVNSNLHFVQRSGGMVCKLQGDEIVRIDNSFSHKSEINCSIFVHNDTIYKYGGYGFWNHRNFFTYFHTTNSDWQIVAPTGSNDLPEGSQESFVKISNDEFYLFGGISEVNNNPLDYYDITAVWKFNKTARTWTKLGELKVDLNKFISIIDYNDKQVFFHNEWDEIFVFDLVNNEIRVHQKNAFHRYLTLEYNSSFIDGTFYCLTYKPNGNGMLLLETRNEDEFFGKLIRVEKLYHNNEALYVGFAIVLVVLILLFSVIKIRHKLKLKKLILVKNGEIIYRRRVISFEENSVRIIEMLLNSKSEITLNDLMKINENKDFNYAHNTRVINLLIENINFKLKSILQIDTDLITYRKSDLDKRMKVFFIDKSYFHISK